MTTTTAPAIRDAITAALASPAPTSKLDALARCASELWDFDARLTASMAGNAQPPTPSEAARNASTARAVRRMVESLADSTGTSLTDLNVIVYGKASR